MDASESADPYLVAQLDDQEYKTTVAKKTLKPVWGETCDFFVKPTSKSLILKLMDSDETDAGNDQHVGTATMELRHLLQAVGSDMKINMLRPESTKFVFSRTLEPCTVTIQCSISDPVLWQHTFSPRRKVDGSESGGTTEPADSEQKRSKQEKDRVEEEKDRRLERKEGPAHRFFPEEPREKGASAKRTNGERRVSIRPTDESQIAHGDSNGPTPKVFSLQGDFVYDDKQKADNALISEGRPLVPSATKEGSDGEHRNIVSDTVARSSTRELLSPRVIPTQHVRTLGRTSSVPQGSDYDDVVSITATSHCDDVFSIPVSDDSSLPRALPVRSASVFDVPKASRNDMLSLRGRHLSTKV